MTDGAGRPVEHRHGALAVLALPNYSRYLAGRFLSSFATQMQTVAVGWLIYDLTRDPLDLGLVGLAQFLPAVLATLPAGQAADRWNRKTLLGACLLVDVVCALALVVFAARGTDSALPVFAVMALFGLARGFTGPASQAMLPNLVPRAMFGNAVGINTTAWQVSAVAGPAAGGFVYLAGPAVVFAVVAMLFAASLLLLALVRSPPQEVSDEKVSWHSLLEGLRFVRRRRSLLGAMSLDLFAVLFGGATALLPAYASDVLHTGPDGLGILRSAPGVGAALVGLHVAWRPFTRQVGRWMFGGVAVFGMATCVFGLSTDFTLSLVALGILGAADMVSVYVRHVLVQLQTPDAIRGRVSAVNSVFIGASNELGEFESGLTAAWWGLVPAVVVGGLASVAVAFLWARWFPALWRLDSFDRLRAVDPPSGTV
ncbi:MAG: MFS transporter [Steroidobacteraceae bacterium]